MQTKLSINHASNIWTNKKMYININKLQNGIKKRNWNQCRS